MQITKNSGRFLGLLFLISVLTGAWGTSLRGLSGIEPNTSGFLLELIKSASEMQLAICLDMIASTMSIVIAVFLYPIISKYSSRIAMTYSGLAFLSFGIITLSNILHFAMLTVAEEFSAGGGRNPEDFTVLTAFLHDGYYRLHFLMLLLYGIGGIILHYFFYNSRLVHKWLAIWGMVASFIVCLGGTLQSIDIKVPFLLFLQNGIFILIFIFYLLILGFQTPLNRNNP